MTFSLFPLTARKLLIPALFCQKNFTMWTQGLQEIFWLQYLSAANYNLKKKKSGLHSNMPDTREPHTIKFPNQNKPYFL